MPLPLRIQARRAALFAACLSASSLAQAQGYSAQFFAAPSGLSNYHGAGLNDSGLVAAYGYTPAFRTRSFFYDTAVSATPLPALVPAEFQVAYATSAVNNAGQAAGSASTGSVANAMLWAAPGSAGTPTGTLGGTNSQALGLNNAGVMVGYADTATTAFRPALFTASGIVDIGATAINGLAYDLSDSGLAVGLADLGQGHNNAVWFDYANGRVVDLSGPGGGEAAALSINESGIAVGTASGPGGQRATLFDLAAGTALDLGVLSGFNASNAYSINNAGQVVGVSRVGLTTRPFIWDATHGMRDLISLLPAGITLTNVSAINNAGQILGDSCIGSTCTVVLLTPVPEPAPWALLAAGVVGMSLVRRRSRQHPLGAR